VTAPAAGDPGFRAVVDGWRTHQAPLLDCLRPLTDEQRALRPSPDHWAIWQLASNMAGGRAQFRVASTTVPGLPLERSEAVDRLMLHWLDAVAAGA
jgi:hypothetical protein